jgi:hypothetical protein
LYSSLFVTSSITDINSGIVTIGFSLVRLTSNKLSPFSNISNLKY